MESISELAPETQLTDIADRVKQVVATIRKGKRKLIEAQSAYKGYQKNMRKYFMDTLSPTSRGVQQMKENLKVTVEQAKTFCDTTLDPFCEKAGAASRCVVATNHSNEDRGQTSLGPRIVRVEDPGNPIER